LRLEGDGCACFHGTASFSKEVKAPSEQMTGGRAGGLAQGGLNERRPSLIFALRQGPRLAARARLNPG
jgi:hypothetical protein